jgi:hypothetical protein
MRIQININNKLIEEGHAYVYEGWKEKTIQRIMGLDISVISNLEPFELPEGMEPWSDEYYEWSRETEVHDYKEVISLYQAGHWGQDRYGDYPPGVYLGENHRWF